MTRKTEGMFISPFSVLCQLFEGQQQQNDASSGQNMADARNPGNRGAGSGRERQSPHLGHTAYHQHDGRQRNADVVYSEERPEGLELSKVVMGAVQRHHQKYQHSQQEKVGVDLPQRRHAGEAAVLGEFPVKDAAHHSGNGIGKSDIQILFHSYNPPFCERHRRGYETRVLSPVKLVCYTVHGSVRYTTQTVEVSGGAV